MRTRAGCRRRWRHCGSLWKGAGIAGLKGAMRAMGRDCGQPRPPLDPLGAEAYENLAAGLAAMPALEAEPRGW